MGPLIKTLQADINEKENQLESLRAQLSQIQRNCLHDWTDPVSDDIVTPAYTDPGDAPCYVPEVREKRWKRQCRNCDLIQHTHNSELVKTEVPVFLQRSV